MKLRTNTGENGPGGEHTAERAKVAARMKDMMEQMQEGNVG